jgi:hypothetical protein
MREPLAPRHVHHGRVMNHAATAAVMIGSALAIGIVGYHFTAGLAWLDSLVNASMILAGMGPVDIVHSTGGKWFESLYAIFSGVVFLTSVGVLLAPSIHRALHRFHLDAATK